MVSDTPIQVGSYEVWRKFVEDETMLNMRLKRPFGQFPAGVILQFEPASSGTVRPGDIVLSGLDDATLFPHLVTDSGDLTPFGYVSGERCNIRYRAIAVTTEMEPL